MRRALLLVLLLAVAALAGDATTIHVYRHGKVLGYDKDVGETLHEALIETWSCETGELEGTERVETYFHLSEDGEVLTPRAICDRCRERFELEKAGSKWIFKGKKKPAETPKATAPRPKETKTPTAPVASPARAAIDKDALAELERKVSLVAGEITRIDPREVSSGAKRRHLIEDRGLQVAFSEWKEDAQAASAAARAIEDRNDLSVEDRYYVLRSFAWQRYHDHDSKAATLLYERAIACAPEWSSAHYGLALVKKDEKDKEGELVELARAIRAKPKRKYAKLLLDAAKGVKAVGGLDAASLERLRAGAEDAKSRLEQSPPDAEGARAAIDASIGKLLDERFPAARRRASAPEPDDEK